MRQPRHRGHELDLDNLCVISAHDMDTAAGHPLTLLLTETRLYPLRQFSMVVESVTVPWKILQDATRASADSFEGEMSGRCVVLLVRGTHPPL